MLALDDSGSISRDNFQKMMSFARNLVMELPVGSGSRVGFITFDNTEKVYFNLLDFSTKIDILNTLSLTYFFGGTTNTAAALGAMGRLFRQVPGGSGRPRQVGILVTDGRSNDPTGTWQEARILREDGVHLMAVAVGPSPDLEELYNIVNAPEKNNVFVAPDWNNLGSVLSDVVSSTCNGVYTRVCLWSL